MLKFMLKKTILSPVLWLILIVTSVMLFLEFGQYYNVLPITSQQDLDYLSGVGASRDFTKALYTYDEETQLIIIHDYYSDILAKDENLSEEERSIIKNRILNAVTVDSYYEAEAELFESAVAHYRADQQQLYYDRLVHASGETYEDVNTRINDALAKHRISEYFAMRFADRIMIIWALFLFLFVSVRYCTLNRNNMKDLLYAKTYQSSNFVGTNLCIDFIFVALLTAFQTAIFGISFNANVSQYFSVSLADYFFVFATWVLPTIIIILCLLYFLYYIFDTPVIVFPIYFIFYSIVSVAQESGYVINKTNIILRYDTLFEPLSATEYTNLIFNRIFLFVLSTLLIIGMIYVLNKKRTGKFNFPQLRLKRTEETA